MNSMTRTWVNGQEATQLSVFDRGLQYGDGLFETMRMVDGQIALWPQHRERLQQGCQRLRMTFDAAQIEQQLAVIQQQVVTGVVKLIVTRGASERGYRVQHGQAVTVLWMCTELSVYPEQYYRDGVDITICETTLSRNTSLAGLKHLNRLENVLARMEWQDEYQEGLMADDNAHIVEGTMSNVFFLDNDTLVTPDIQHSGVAGIMRQQLLDIAHAEGVRTSVRNVPLAELDSFESIMLSNSLIGAWPVRRVRDQAYTISALARHLVERVRACQN